MTEAGQVMVFSTNPEADIAFARDLLGLSAARADGGWLIFALPPGQSGIDDFGGDDAHQVYLECRDLDRAIAALRQRGVEAGAVTEEDWGRWVSVALPGGGKVRLHEPGGKRPALP